VLFLKYPNHVLSYEVIIDNLWESDKSPTQSSIRSHIKGLRKSFKEANVPGEIIETVHSLGYRLKPLKSKQLDKPLISPSLSALEGFLTAKAVEYLVLDEQLTIQYISPNLQTYCDYPDLLKLDNKAEFAFPEFIGLEEVFQKIINQERNNFEIKGIARASNPNRPEYINMYIMLDPSNLTDKTKHKNLFVFFEDTSEVMIYKQQIVQIQHEYYLRLEVESHNAIK
jgi:hypothetical protein